MKERLLDPRDHPRKEIREALERICTDGAFRIVAGGHWGSLRCIRGCCEIAVSGTPRVPARHARDLERKARQCPLPVDDPRNRRRN